MLLSATPTRLDAAFLECPSITIAIRPKNAVDLIKSSEWEVKTLVNELLHKEKPPICCNIKINNQLVIAELIFDNVSSRHVLARRLKKECTVMIGRTAVSVTLADKNNQISQGRLRKLKWKESRSVLMRRLPARLLGLNSTASSDERHTSPSLGKDGILWTLLDQMAKIESENCSDASISAIERMEVVSDVCRDGDSVSMTSLPGLLVTVCVQFTTFELCQRVTTALGYSYNDDGSEKVSTTTTTTTVVLQQLTTKRTFRFTVSPDEDDDYFFADAQCKQRHDEMEKLNIMRNELRNFVFSVGTNGMPLGCQLLVEEAREMIDKGGNDSTSAVPVEDSAEGAKIAQLLEQLDSSRALLSDHVAAVAAPVPRPSTTTATDKGGDDQLTQPVTMVLKASLSLSALKHSLADIKRGIDVVKHQHALLHASVSALKHKDRMRKEVFSLKITLEHIMETVSASTNVYSRLIAHCRTMDDACEVLRRVNSTLQLTDFNFSTHAKCKMKVIVSQVGILQKLLEKQTRLDLKRKHVNLDIDILPKEGDDEFDGIEKVKICVDHSARNASALKTCCEMIHQECEKQKLKSFFRVVGVFAGVAEDLLASYTMVTEAIAEDVEEYSTQLPGGQHLGRETSGVLTEVKEQLASFFRNHMCAYFVSLSGGGSQGCVLSDASQDLLCRQVWAIRLVCGRVCGEVRTAEKMIAWRRCQLDGGLLQTRTLSQSENQPQTQADMKRKDVTQVGSIVALILTEDVDGEDCEDGNDFSEARGLNDMQRIQIVTNTLENAVVTSEKDLVRVCDLLRCEMNLPRVLYCASLSSDDETNALLKGLNEEVNTFMNVSSLSALTSALETSGEECERQFLACEDALGLSLRAHELEKRNREVRKRELMKKVDDLKKEAEEVIREKKRKSRSSDGHGDHQTGVSSKARRQQGRERPETHTKHKDRKYGHNITAQAKAFDVRSYITGRDYSGRDIAGGSIKTSSANANSDKECNLRELLLRKKLLVSQR